MDKLNSDIKSPDCNSSVEHQLLGYRCGCGHNPPPGPMPPPPIPPEILDGIFPGVNLTQALLTQPGFCKVVGRELRRLIRQRHHDKLHVTHTTRPANQDDRSSTNKHKQMPIPYEFTPKTKVIDLMKNWRNITGKSKVKVEVSSNSKGHDLEEREIIRHMAMELKMAGNSHVTSESNNNSGKICSSCTRLCILMLSLMSQSLFNRIITL